ncbi:MAG: bifunctional diguanylate cyclase/phosphodiesterase [Bacteroidota bacterium]
MPPPVAPRAIQPGAVRALAEWAARPCIAVDARHQWAYVSQRAHAHIDGAAGWYAHTAVAGLHAQLLGDVEATPWRVVEQDGIHLFYIQDEEAPDATAALVEQGYQDPLTRLANRLLFTDRLQTALVLRERDPSYTCAVLFIDLDRFKTINDGLGHAVGDIVLAEVGRRLQECTRASDTAARLGGDEFGILLEYLDRPATAHAVVQRILDRLRQPYRLLGDTVALSASIGVVIVDAAHTRPAGVLHDADQAMFTAKQRGGNQYHVSRARTDATAQHRMEDDVWHAIERDELTVVYQPVQALATGHVVAHEALVRWTHPVHGVVPPAQFIPMAEENGFIHQLDLWVLQTSCRHAVSQRWNGKLLVNTSSRRFRNTHMVDEVADVLQRTGWPAERLVLEITEHALMHDVLHTADVLAQLHALGVEIWIDDFGSGYASLHWLHALPVDALKIDGSFIERLAEEAKASVIVQAIIDMAHTLGLKVVAEGIETEAQRARVRELGADMGQGYFLGRPA